MKGTPTTFWGKLERKDGAPVVEWHPLNAHCADVAACAEALLQHSILRKRLAALGARSDLDETDIARLSALAALHDIGKFNLGFQRKGDAAPKDTAGHVSEVVALFGTNYSVGEQLYRALPSEALAAWCEDEAAFKLLIAAIGHHGKPVACDGHTVDSSLWRATAGLDPFRGIAELSALVRTWFPGAFETGRGTLPRTPAFQHGFAGLVMLADWLGSDGHEHMFPFAHSLDDRMPFARERARRAVVRIGLDVTAGRSALGLTPASFQAVSPFAPRDVQSKIIELPRDEEGSLTVLEAETGSGKTEAALIRFVHLFQAGLVDGMTFALPTRTAATQLHRRVIEATARAFPDETTRPSVILAVPGYLQFDDTLGRKLPGFEVLWNDDKRERDRYRGWPAEQPKRYLAGAIVVGTIDQVLLSSLRVGHAHLRATALLRHLLVVDEVHASDAYMNRVLEEVLRFHLAAGGHAFLMSATLGSFVRRRLERASLGRGETANDATLTRALDTPYPVVHHASRTGQPQATNVDAPGLPKRIHIGVEALAEHPNEIAKRALNAARAGARVIVLRNTVSDAVATQLALETLVGPADSPMLFVVSNVHTLHHARFARADRELLDNAIEARFGKLAPAGVGAIAITTQTVQQSLDLDADVMWTDLAPMDVLLQRFGRVHRHRERDGNRPLGFETPRAFVLVSETPLESHLRPNGDVHGGRHGVGTVYDDLTILEATRQRLVRRSVLSIPEDNRELVELTTHPEALSALAEQLGGYWPKHQAVVGGRYFAARGIADLNLVDREAHFGEYSFNNTGLPERITSRLGENDRRVLFDLPVPGPFGNAIRELNIPGWLARGIANDANLVPDQVQTSSTEVTFLFGGIDFSYDRLGIRKR